MRKILCSNVLRTSAFALACLALAGTDVKADAMMTGSTTPTMMSVSMDHTYSTGYTIANSGISSPDGSTPINAISFTPIQSGAYTTPSAISVGEFQVAKLSAGQEVDYNATPFTITYNPLPIVGATSPDSTGPVMISGTLTGSITGSTSNVKASFNSITAPTFSSVDGNYVSTLSVADNPLSLVASSAGGITTVQAMVATTGPVATSTPQLPPLSTTTPEPTTFAILATSLVGLGLRHRLRSGRKAS